LRFDRDVFGYDEAFLAEAEADLVVVLALGIVEVLLSAGLTAQAADGNRRVVGELAHAASLLVGLPARRVDPAILTEGKQQIIAIAWLAHRVSGSRTSSCLTSRKFEGGSLSSKAFLLFRQEDAQATPSL